MKKLFLLFSVSFLLSSCMALHSGYPSGSAALSSANFKYINKNVTGTSLVTYVFGIGGLDNKALVNNAIIDMKNGYPLGDNQAYANMSINFQKVFVLLGLVVEVHCDVSADIVEFQK